MNYRHTFHAGNFADVVKHFVLCLILEKIQEKPTPFFVLDTHAGQGIYDLQSTEAQRTAEAESGILKLLAQPSLHPLFESYLRVIKNVNHSKDPCRFYPGSPKIVQSFLRQQDRLVLAELHPQSHRALKILFQEERRVHVLEQNGYMLLKSMLPPPEKRGVVLIDPSFEDKDEFMQLATGLTQALKRFAHGIYIVWYPIKYPEIVADFQHNVQKILPQKTLTIDFYLDKNTRDRLQGSGLMILNPPWMLEEKLREALPTLLPIFGKTDTGEICFYKG